MKSVVCQSGCVELAGFIGLKLTNEHTIVEAEYELMKVLISVKALKYFLLFKVYK